MKKLMTALAICALAGMASAGDVVSENVVGYNTLTFKQGFNLIGIQFEAVAVGGALDIQKIFSGVTLNGIDDEANYGDFMQVWDNASGSFVAIYYWGDNETLELDPAWYDVDFNLATHAFKPGDAFWVYTSVGGSAAGAIAAGQVVKTNTVINVKTGFNLLSNPYPIDFVINGTPGVTVNGLVGVDDEANYGDFMQVWDNATGSFVAIYYWGDNETLELDPAWYDVDFNLVTGVSIAPNTAFWVYHGGTGASLTFGTPL